MMEIDQNWWMRLFDETYLLTDARTVGDDALTCREVDFLEHLLEPEKSWPILDLCGGQGRHSIELSRRGFQDVTVLDYSEVLLHLGEESGRAEGLTTRFVKGDARDTVLPGEGYRIVILMASSFGYFVDDAENNRILRETFRLLLPKGTLLLDLPKRSHVIDHINPQSWHEADEGIVVCRRRRLEGDTIFSRELVISKEKGLIRDAHYSINLYTQEKITTMLKSTGFGSVTVHADFISHDNDVDYGCMSNRMIVTACKD